jgi:hypothetical protein
VLGLIAFAIFGPLVNMLLWTVAERWYFPYNLPVEYGFSFWARVFAPRGDGAYRIEQQFRAYAQERLYGLGQHPHGRLDQKGCTLDLVQALRPNWIRGRGAQSIVVFLYRQAFTSFQLGFASAVGEYERIWTTDAARIARTMQEVSGLMFADTAINAIVYEGVSSSGFRDTPMRLHARYPLDTKSATLIHELGHRLQSSLFRRQDEDHAPLFLWLYDSWVRLYGKEFADAQVVIEKRRGGPYPRAWDEALALSPKERAERWRAGPIGPQTSGTRCSAAPPARG